MAGRSLAVRLGAMLGAAYFPLSGPSFEQRELRVLAARDADNPGAPGNAPNVTLPANGTEQAYGPFVVFTPQVLAEYAF